MPDSSRLLRQLPDGQRVYVITDTQEDFCVFIPEREMGCGGSLTPARPIMASSFGDAMHGEALDGVTTVSFEIAGQDVSVRVKDNVWAYEGPHGATLPKALVAHFADGTTVTVRE